MVLFKYSVEQVAMAAFKMKRKKTGSIWNERQIALSFSLFF